MNIYKILNVVLIITLMFLFPFKVEASTYYVSNSGNDSCNGTSQTIGVSGSCAWKTIAKVNATSFSAGDTVSFNKGDIWREQLDIPSSGSIGTPITFNSYGSGNKPKIYGSDVPSSWTLEEYLQTPTLTKVQGITNSGAGASVTRSYTNPPSEGNLLVAVGWGTNSDSNASITGWTKAVAVQTGTNSHMALFYKIATNGESQSVTLNWTSSSSTQIVLEEWSGLITPVLDQIASTANTGAVTSKSSGTTATTTGNYEILIAGFGHGGSVTSRSYTNSFTEDYDVISSNTWQVASRTVSTTGTYSTTQSWTTSRLSGGLIATFKGTEDTTTLHYTTQTSNPGDIWFIDTEGDIHKGNEVASKDLLLSEYDWWLDSGNNRLYIYAATDPLTRYSSVEVASLTRDRGITWTDPNHDYTVIDGFEVAFINGVGIVQRSNAEIKYNHVHHVSDSNNHGYGIEINTGSNCIISHNEIHDTESAGFYTTASYDSNISSDNIIEYNTIYDAEGTLVYITTGTAGVEAEGNIIRYNNLYHTNSFTPTTGDGITFKGRSGYPLNSGEIYYNIINSKYVGISFEDYVTNSTIFNNSIISKNGRGIEIYGTGTSGIEIKNNLIANAGTNGLRVMNSSSISVCDYNIWYVPTGTSYAYVDSTNYYSGDFSTYKSTTGWDTNGFWENPLIISSSTPDFRLQRTSPIINEGINVSLTTDYIGSTVPQGSTPDIGAYEYIPLNVTINQASGQSDPTSSTTINFTVVFSESVSDFTTGDVTLSGTAGATTATVTGSGTTYNAAVTGMTTDGTIITSIVAGIATGTTENTNNTSTSTDNTVTFTNNNSPTNDSLTFINPHEGSGNDAITDNTTEWNFRAVISDTNGYSDFDSVILRLANSTDSTTPFDSLKFTWTEVSDAFSETTDTQGAASITSTGADSSCTTNTCTIDFKIKFNSNFTSQSTEYNVELYTTDNASATDTDTYTNFYQVTPFAATISISSPINISLGTISGTGDSLTGEAIWTVITDNPNGYKLEWQSDNESMLNSTSDEIGPYTPNSIDTPETWTVSTNTSEWGGRLKSTSTDYSSSTWGIDDSTNSKWLNIKSSSPFQIVNRGSSTAGSDETIEFKSTIGSNKLQPTGIYNVNITITATTL